MFSCSEYPRGCRRLTVEMPRGFQEPGWRQRYTHLLIGEGGGRTRGGRGKGKGEGWAWESEGQEKGKPGLRLLFHSPHGHHLLPFQEHQEDSNWHSDPGCGNANHCATCQSQNQVFLMLDSLFSLLVHQSFFLKEQCHSRKKNDSVIVHLTCTELHKIAEASFFQSLA